MATSDISSSITTRPRKQDPTFSAADGDTRQTISVDVTHRIQIHHPHYPATHNLLLELFAPDHPEGGIDHGLARTICGIIAGNRWDGWFSESIEGPKPLPRIDHRDGSVLRAKKCYFHLDSSTAENPYPIVPSFREWWFPHDNLPLYWPSPGPIPLPLNTRPPRFLAASSLYPALSERDKSCRMSACEEATQSAHLIPKSEEDWFNANSMSMYNKYPLRSGPQILDDTSNALLLRADLHQLFDTPKFVFVPKFDNSESQWVTHLLVPSYELGILYHNTALQTIPGVSRECLLGRLAWAIFQFIEPFLKNGLPKYLVGSTISASNCNPAVLVNASQCNDIAKASKSRCASPKKRGRVEDEREEDAFSADGDSRTRPNKRMRASSKGLPRNSCSDVTPTAPSTGSKTPVNPAPHNPEFTERWRLELRRYEWLKKERLHSDPGESWKEEERWVSDMQGDDNKVMGPDETQRLHEYYGFEYVPKMNSEEPLVYEDTSLAATQDDILAKGLPLDDAV